jgi:hypothetical protein
MSKTLLSSLVGLGLGLGMAANAAAQAPAPDYIATLTKIEGERKVMVNGGEEFKPAVEGMRLKAGDRILVQDDSSAELKYDDECEDGAEENQIMTVPDMSPCAGGVPVVQNLNPAGAGGVVGATASGSNGTGLWLAMAIQTAIYFWLEDDDDTVSP